MQIQEFFEGQSWRLARTMLSRLHKDPRARSHVGTMAGIVLLLAAVPIALVGLVAAIVVAPQSTPMFGSLVGLLVAFAFGYGGSISRRQAALDRAAEAVPISVREGMVRTAYWLTVLMRRAGSEIALLKEMPPGIVIVTRRVLLDRLKQLGIWEEMPLKVRELLLKPDGAWTEEERNEVAHKFEVLHCLQWVACKTEPLQMLGLPPQYTYPSDEDTLPDAEWVREKKMVSPITIVERQKTAARLHDRCFVELVARGLVAVPEDDREKVAEMQGAIKKRDDWMYGRCAIHELAVAPLRQHFERIRLRYHTLRAVLLAVDAQSDAPIRKLMEGAFRSQDSENKCT